MNDTQRDDVKILHGLLDQLYFPAMNRDQYEFTVKVVRAVLDPWLKLHFGERCDDYEHGCECCQRWAMADRLLAYDRIGTPENLEREIEVLKQQIVWREEMLARFERQKTSQGQDHV